MEFDENLIKQAEYEKLNLEIQNLKKQNSFVTKFSGYVPILTVLIAIIGFWFGVVRFLSDKKIERSIRIDHQIQTNINRLLEFPSDDNFSISEVLFHITDLNTLLTYNPERRGRLTDIFIELVSHDCNFDRYNHVRFDVVLLREWEGYMDFLSHNPQINDEIIYKYFQALRHLHDKEPAYIESIYYDQNLGFQVKGYTKESRFVHFVNLLSGYVQHVKILQEDSDMKIRAIERFEEATKNAGLTESIFGDINSWILKSRR